MKKIFLRLWFVVLELSAYIPKPSGLLVGVLTGVGNRQADAVTSTGTGTSVAGAVTINKDAGVITTESLTTAAGANFTLTLTNSEIAATDRLLVTLNDYTGGGIPCLLRASTAAGSSVILIRNIDALAALDAPLTLSFQVGKAIV